MAVKISTAEFFKRTVIVVAVALVPVLVWYLFNVILIAMGAILVAVLLRLIAEPFTRWLRFPESLALIVSGLVLLGVLGATTYIFGAQVSSEFREVIRRADEAQSGMMAMLEGSQFGRFVLGHVSGGSISISDFLSRAFTISASVLEAIVVTVIAGIYLAAQPTLYYVGLSELFPKRLRGNVHETVIDVANALRLWLLGQLIEMLLIGLLSTLAVWLIGLPSPFALGLIAGLLEFIPYLGPILASIPALLVAATKDFDAMLWTLVAYIVIHQTEGNLIVPLVQRHMVYIPPAVMLLGIVAISFLFGTVAIIFAAPIAVVLFVLVKKLYVHDSLGEDTPIPGEPKEAS